MNSILCRRFGRTSEVFSIENGMLLMNRLSNNGLRKQPWGSPSAYGKECVWLFLIFMEHLEFEYKLFNNKSNLLH